MKRAITRITKLSSGYWQVWFGSQQFAQWPSWESCEREHIFGAMDDVEAIALVKLAEEGIAAAAL